MKSKAYRAVPVKDVKVSEIVLRLAEGPVWVGMDVGKGHTMVIIRDVLGTTLRPWKVLQPDEIRVVVQRLTELQQHRPLVVAMEPTGTYGDALRQALFDADMTVHRVSPKATSDYAEVYDGVPSQHDGKDAAVVAELASIGKSCLWPMGPVAYGELLQDVQWMDTQQDILQLWLGRLEALLARHWPELTTLLELNSATLLRLLIEYGGPRAVCADVEASANLKQWGRTLIKPEKIAAVVESARTTQGVRMEPMECAFIQRCARAAWAARKEIQQVQNVLKKRAVGDEKLQRVGQAVGMVTACVLFATAGDPTEYSCGEAYRKALGLNLKERSSGRHQGHLKITKRGPSMARRWLYFSALRLIQHHAVKPWYERKKSRTEERGGKGVVAVMRKLSLAVYAVARGATFDARRLFPGCQPTTEAGPGAALGALPPDPRNLSPAHQSRTKNRTAGASPLEPAARSASVTDTALGSVSTGALSSVPAKQE
ncbi:MAG: transposase [Planctomycetales bacterium]